MQTKMLINGELVEGGGAAIPVLNPATGEEICIINAATSEQADAAAAAAHEAFDTFGPTSPAERSQLLTDIADVLQANIEELAELESLDAGKPWPSALNDETPLTLDTFRFFAGDGLDPADARSNGGFMNDFKKTDAARCGHVRAATQLH